MKIRDIIDSHGAELAIPASRVYFPDGIRHQEPERDHADNEERDTTSHRDRDTTSSRTERPSNPGPRQTEDPQDDDGDA